MRLHRFYIKTDLSNNKLTIADKETINQVKNVFRLRKGEQFMVFNDKKEEVVATIKNISSDELSAEVEERIQNDSEPKNKIDLYLSILKKENFELVVQKATEVGVSKIVPIISARTVKMNLNMERLQKIAKEASEQCGRQTIPEISEPIKIKEAFEEASKSGLKIFFDISGEDIKNIPLEDKKETSIFIGAEGGWDEWEVEMAKEKGFHIASLSKLTLRSETAAIVATYLVVN